jgi:outer membrane protein OmpA-like peptidoglycan-associated protein
VIVVDRVTVTPEPAPTVDPTPSTDPTPPPRGDGDATAVSRSGRLLKTRPPLRYDGYGVDSSASGTLDDLAAYLTAHPEIELLEIGVHTDDRGSPKARSMSRANAVVNGLTERGIARERLVARGYGDADPVAVNLTPDGRRQNNRTVLKIRGAK